MPGLLHLCVCWLSLCCGLFHLCVSWVFPWCGLLPCCCLGASGAEFLAPIVLTVAVNAAICRCISSNTEMIESCSFAFVVDPSKSLAFSWISSIVCGSLWRMNGRMSGDRPFRIACLICSSGNLTRLPSCCRLEMKSCTFSLGICFLWKIAATFDQAWFWVGPYLVMNACLS